MFKKSVTASLIFGLANVALAGTMGSAPACSPLCAVDQKGGFYASVSGYWVEPSETGIGMVSDSWQYLTSTGIVARSKPITPKSRWQWGVGAGYDFANSANNIEFNYFNLDSKTHAVNRPEPGTVTFGSIFFPDVVFPVFPGFVSDAQLQYKIHQGDLKVGRKYTDAQARFDIRVSLGIRAAELEHALTFIQPGNVISKFNGAGPMLSFEGHYGLYQGLGLVGYIDDALMTGKTDAHSFVNLEGFDFAFSSPKVQRTVNNLNIRAALDYQYAFSNAANLGIEAGYQISNYSDVFDIIRGNITTGQRIAGIESNSFSFQGPYVTLAAHM